jgi:3,4-dihydroxy 2-butanone 4-phosphate synthase
MILNSMTISSIEKAISELKKGKFVLVYDGDKREGEADLIIGAKFAKPEKIEQMRKDAGGLICVAVDSKLAEEAGLQFYTDILLKTQDPKLKTLICSQTAYGDKPAFSISVNHRNVYTGITDEDRSLTITKLAAGNWEQETFAENFYTPGHVFLLIGRGLENRKGHTELALELGKNAGLDSIVLCEMLGKGKALPKNDVKKYAKKNGLVFVEGKEIIENLE